MKITHHNALREMKYRITEILHLQERNAKMRSEIDALPDRESYVAMRKSAIKMNDEKIQEHDRELRQMIGHYQNILPENSEVA